MSKPRILLTGSAGFIFSNFVEKFIADAWTNEYELISIDNLVEPFNRHNLNSHHLHKFYLGDISDPHLINNIFEMEKPDIVLHSAAESHVDHSILSAIPFVKTNIVGTQVLIDASVKHNIKRFIFISTDEVYGHISRENEKNIAPWIETDELNPRSPYSASKASAEFLVQAAHQTHNLQYNITRCCNVFGKNQRYKNLVPKIITSLIKDQPIPIHGTGDNKREWIYVENQNEKMYHLIKYAKPNEIYNIGPGKELSNLDMVKTIAKIMNKEPNIKFVEDRKGHDYKYSINSDKFDELEKDKQKEDISFKAGIKQTVEWYMENYKKYLDI